MRLKCSICHQKLTRYACSNAKCPLYKKVIDKEQYEPRMIISDDKEDTFTRGTETEITSKKPRHYLGS